MPPSGAGSQGVQKLQQGSLLKERILAFLIDFGAVISISLLLGFSVALGLSISFGEDINALLPVLIAFALVLGIILHPVYFILLEGKYSTTYGKRLMKITVRCDEGEIGFRRSIVRNGMRFIEAATLYIISIIMIRQNGLRLGDRFAKTYVIKRTPAVK